MDSPSRNLPNTVKLNTEQQLKTVIKEKKYRKPLTSEEKLMDLFPLNEMWEQIFEDWWYSLFKESDQEEDESEIISFVI